MAHYNINIAYYEPGPGTLLFSAGDGLKVLLNLLASMFFTLELKYTPF